MYVISVCFLCCHNHYDLSVIINSENSEMHYILESKNIFTLSFYLIKRNNILHFTLNRFAYVWLYKT